MSRLIFIIAFVLLLAGAGFIWFHRGTSFVQNTGNTAELETRLSDLRRISQIHLDTSILQDPVFRSLQPAPQTPSNEQQPGRTNPFLPFR